ncbi:MAG TPA: hypothetical protein VGI92_09055 [Gemmatimonadales bacterium]|jgi:hypothetical protein
MSTLDELLPPQISKDGFSQAIVKVAATSGVKTILEIGASSGQGSTEALVAGAMKNPGGPPAIHSIEVSKARIGQFQERWKQHAFVTGYNTSSVPTASFPTREEVTRFYREVRSKLRNVRLEKVLGWLQADLDYLIAHPDLDAPGIRRIKESTGIAIFDAVLIDGSEFTGEVELPEVYGARFIMLDDTRSYKNWNNLKQLSGDSAYRAVKKSRWTRNGWAVFERVTR